MYKVAERNLRRRRARSKRVAQPRGKKHKKPIPPVQKWDRKRFEKLEIGRVYPGIVVKVLESGVLVDIGKVWGKLDVPLMLGQPVPVRVVGKDIGRNVLRSVLCSMISSRRKIKATVHYSVGGEEVPF